MNYTRPLTFTLLLITAPLIAQGFDTRTPKWEFQPSGSSGSSAGSSRESGPSSNESRSSSSPMPHPSPSAQRRLKRIQAAEELESAKQHGENAVNEPDLEKAHEEASKVYDTPGLRFGPIVVAGINVPAGVARDPAFNALARDLQRLDERVDSLEQRLKGVRAKRLADKESPALARMEKVLGEQVSDAKLQQEQAKQQMVKFVVAWDEANAEGHAAGANQGSGDSRRSRTGNK